MAKIAVLTRKLIDENLEGYVLISEAGELDWYYPTFDAENLFHMLAHFEIDQCWVVPGCARVELLAGGVTIMREQPDDEQGRSFIHANMPGYWRINKYGDDHLSSAHGYREGGTPAERKLRSIIWPEYSGWQWEEMEGIAMLRALNRLQAALGVDLSSSPGVTGRKFVIKTLNDQNHAHWLGSVVMDLESLPLKDGVADLAWKKQNIIEDILLKERLYLHCIDKNSMYLSAAAGLPHGIGNPVWHGSEEFIGIAPKLNGAGLYQISVTPPNGITEEHPWHLLYDGTFGPDPLYGSAEKENRQEWVSSALLKLLYDFGYGVKIQQAWVWPASKRILEVPATLLWNIRQELHNEFLKASADADQAATFLAYSWIKTIATSFIGLFASDMVKDTRYKRRDIWRNTIEAAKARMLYNIDKIAEEANLFPVAVLTDALYYLSPDPAAASALGKIMSRSDQLGGFKVAWSLEVDAAVVSALEEKTVTGMAGKLNAIAEKREAAYKWK